MEQQEITLGDLVHIKHGWAFKGEYFSESGKYIVVTPGNFFEDGGFRLREGKEKYYLDDFPRDYLLKKNDLILAMTEQGEGLLGSPALIPNDDMFLHNQRIGLVQILDNTVLCKEYLYYLFFTSYIRKTIANTSTGTKVRHTSPRGMYKLKINLPPLKTQQKIASLLSNYDKLIENNTQRITLLESMAEELYKEWFVRLCFPGYEDVEVVDGVPEGWERKSLDKYLKYHRGKSYSSEDIAGDTGLPFINLKCIKRNGGFRRDGIKVFNGEYKESNVAHEGDIVMAVTDMTQDRAIVGRVARVPTMNQDKYIVSMDLVKIEPLDIEKDFLYALLRFSGIGLLLKEFANGVNVLHLTPDMIYLQKVTIPVKNLQIKFEKILAPILREIDILNLKNDELKQTRDLLLPRLMSAKLNVEDLDII